MKSEDFIKNIFQKYKEDEIYFIGLGNPYRSDDGVGIKFISKIKNHFKNAFTEFDNITEIVMNLCNNNEKGLVIFVDSSDFQAEAGEIRITVYDEIEDFGKHFHKIPLKLYMKLLQNASKQTFLIAIQPESIEEINEPELSNTVKASLNFMIKQFI
ncbi:MAG: hydrogenase maturation protease [Armatimonadetes bacterium]|nr:hydrogenase maturation protease [Armatimonadota bacterium]